MRIIAGEFRGRQLLAPKSDATRPITDRAKQSLFDILSPVIEGAMVYDLFSGTGSMGLECLSRGAKSATFFEADRSATELLKKNIATFNVGKRSRVVMGDLFIQIDREKLAEPLGLVFLDPPYRFLRERANQLQDLAIKISQRMKPDALLVFRHDSADSLMLPNMERRDERTYGQMAIEILGTRD